MGDASARLPSWCLESFSSYWLYYLNIGGHQIWTHTTTVTFMRLSSLKLFTPCDRKRIIDWAPAILFHPDWQNMKCGSAYCTFTHLGSLESDYHLLIHSLSVAVTGRVYQGPGSSGCVSADLLSTVLLSWSRSDCPELVFIVCFAAWAWCHTSHPAPVQLHLRRSGDFFLFFSHISTHSPSTGQSCSGS